MFDFNQRIKTLNGKTSEEDFVSLIDELKITKLKFNNNLLVDLLEDNKQLYKETQGIMQKVYFADFKIVPSSVIHAAINNTSAKVVDCYFKESKNKD